MGDPPHPVYNVSTHIPPQTKAELPEPHACPARHQRGADERPEREERGKVPRHQGDANRSRREMPPRTCSGLASKHRKTASAGEDLEKPQHRRASRKQYGGPPTMRGRVTARCSNPISVHPKERKSGSRSCVSSPRSLRAGHSSHVSVSGGGGERAGGQSARRNVARQERKRSWDTRDRVGRPGGRSAE